VNLIANVEAKQILLINNEFRSLSLPNGIQVKEFIIEGNRFSQATFNFNFEGRLSMRKNHLKNASTIPAILVVKADSALIENNEIESLQSSAIVLTNTAVSVQIVSNRIEAYSPVIFDESSRDLSIRANTLRSLIGGKEQLTFRSHYPRNLHMSGNTHIGKDGEDVVLFVGKGNALVEEENLLSGVSNYGKVILSTTSDEL
jgi:nitrous oxidase accessory protein NosD